ncbi:hypothetical protein B0H17DRAFT_1137498 [Mycena rosella]|uniref:Uncharacterized protein n=1 Tax=Mycena rosella TaxID=1033263 RepID=A0AAD7D8I6_MYCRO|nr:hypothetical protein B0H17DRAFT_1137498 [Mycena rosella]
MAQARVERGTFRCPHGLNIPGEYSTDARRVLPGLPMLDFNLDKHTLASQKKEVKSRKKHATHGPWPSPESNGDLPHILMEGMHIWCGCTPSATRPCTHILRWGNLKSNPTADGPAPSRTGIFLTCKQIDERYGTDARQLLRSTVEKREATNFIWPNSESKGDLPRRYVHALCGTGARRVLPGLAINIVGQKGKDEPEKMVNLNHNMAQPRIERGTFRCLNALLANMLAPTLPPVKKGKR